MSTRLRGQRSTAPARRRARTAHAKGTGLVLSVLVIRMTRSSSGVGLPCPSRLRVVSQSAPSQPTTTVRSRPYTPARSG